jgi:hypothetical protein
MQSCIQDWKCEIFNIIFKGTSLENGYLKPFSLILNYKARNCTCFFVKKLTKFFTKNYKKRQKITKKSLKKITKGKKRGIKIASTIVIPTPKQDSTNSTFYRE